MSFCSRSRRRRLTVLNFKSWAYDRIYGYFQQRVYCACAETLIYVLFVKFRQRHSIPRPRFPVRVQNFGYLATFSVDFWVLYAECPPYFYFRFVSATGLESIPHASTPTSIIPTKFEVDMTTHCRVITFLSVNTSRDLVTLTFDLWPWTAVMHGGSRVFVTMATRVVWAKFDCHHLIGRSRKPPTACKHLGRTFCTR